MRLPFFCGYTLAINLHDCAVKKSPNNIINYQFLAIVYYANHNCEDFVFAKSKMMMMVKSGGKK